MVEPFPNTRFAPGTLVSRLWSRYAHAKPAQGKVILFPPLWTHIHRGVALERGIKYIATTWICFA